MMAERSRATARTTMPVWLGLTAFSAYNVSRIGGLSGSGRGAAVAGLASGLYLTWASMNM